MTIYLDIVFILNFWMDFLLLLTVNITLKRNTPIKRMLFGSLLGSITLLFLFLKIHRFTLILLKLITSFTMCIASYKYENMKYTIQNMTYFYMTGTILGGFLYYLNLEFSYDHQGIIFFHQGLSVNFLFLIIISPIILYIYIRSQRKMKTTYNHYYKMIVTLKNNHCITLNAFLDTGNKLIDPITKKAIILVEKKKFQNQHIKEFLYVPYHSLNHKGLLKCIVPKKITLEGKDYDKYLIGLSEQQFHIDGINCLLNSKCLEDLSC